MLYVNRPALLRQHINLVWNLALYNGTKKGGGERENEKKERERAAKVKINE